MRQQSYFVLAAIVASELHKAMLVARNISLTASNARALALRAGRGAAGFRAITDFIDELAGKTIKASRDINSLAVAISRMASETARTEFTLKRFERACTLAAGAKYLSSLDEVYARAKLDHERMASRFNRQVAILTNELEELSRELRTSVVLAAMSRVEASQSGKQFERPLTVIAANVAEAANNIQEHVNRSQRLFSGLANMGA